MMQNWLAQHFLSAILDCAYLLKKYLIMEAQQKRIMCYKDENLVAVQMEDLRWWRASVLNSSVIHHAFITQSDMPQLISYNLTQIATKFWSDPPRAVQHAINGFDICYRTHLKVPLVKNVTFQSCTPVLWNTPHVFTSELWIFTQLPQCSLHIHEIYICQCTVSDCKNEYVEKQHCWWRTLYLCLAQLGRLAWQLNLTVTYPSKTDVYIGIFYCV